MKTNTNKLAMLVALVALSEGAQAGDKDFPMAVSSATSGESVISAPASGLVTRTGKDNTIIKINNSCFGTNLRGVGNPLAPRATITANLNMVIGGKEYEIMVKYPSQLVTPMGMVAPKIQPMSSSNYKIGKDGGGSAAIFGNTVLLNTPIPAGVTVDSSGKITISDKGSIYLKSYSFEQEVDDCNDKKPVYGSYGYSSEIPTVACGDYMGKSGPVSASFGGISVASDKTSIEVNVAFPGQTGFCGGYWSPLMVFFDDSRPRFDNSSDFPLNPMNKTMWPEANAPGWFVAYDRDKSGLIDKKEELFGDTVSTENGFEVLKKLDSNKDGFIDKKDKTFKKLVLWNDKNGDGISQKEEMLKLAEKVMKISLDYEKGVITPMGHYAEARERSKFWYKDNGKVKTGDIVDIWLSPAPVKLSQN
ncbi:EF-hand domain-containing protein [Bdellovibrio reynosensis]|uniref:EF-hand domain-containing protein n=1 Tax=Bdellovibrio reynosensis TaxID=2835041 RepID=A0ABY4CAM1_9BACT|nr:EF-hand domain-containing protein [Bdellovibrio reynosensis]UOF01819.1 EF-hand domain-containing protein [Bdellovibrio reynosensis]